MPRSPNSLVVRSLLVLALAAGAAAPRASAAARGPAEARWLRNLNTALARSMAGVAYDSRRQRMLVFGGFVLAGHPNDLWALPTAPGSQWQLLAPASAGPKPSLGAVYDSLEDRLLVLSPKLTGGDTLTLFEYSFRDPVGWHDLAPKGDAPGQPPWLIAVAFDPVERRCIAVLDPDHVFACTVDSATTWSRLAPGGGRPRVWSRSAFTVDTRRRRLLMNGGAGSRGTWALDLSGATRWDSLPVALNPLARTDHAAAYDPVRDRLVITGGSYAPGALDAIAAPLDGSAGWNVLLAGDPTLTDRIYATAVYDPSRDAVVVHGGNDGTNQLAETVVIPLDGSRVAAAEPALAEPVTDATMVYDPDRRRMLLFGGQSERLKASDGLYALDLSAPWFAWRRIVPAGVRPTSRYSHSAAWDPVRHRMLVFGGCQGSTDLNELWAYSEDPVAGWSLLATSGTPPAARKIAALGYDPPRDRILLFGGRADPAGGYPNYFSDLWELPLSGGSAMRWRLLAPGGTAPGPHRAARFVYDAAHDRMALLDGLGPDPSSYMLSFGSGDGTWTAWATNSVRTDCSVVAVRGSAAIDHDEQYPDDPDATRLLSLETPATWDTVVLRDQTLPIRYGFCGAYDPVGDRLVVFGGASIEYSSQTAGAVRMCDTWTLNWLGPDNLVVDATGPAPFGMSAPAPNPTRGRVTVQLSLAGVGPASLEVVDVCGRRVWSRRLDAATAGAGPFAFDLSGSLRPGLYFLRIDGGGRSVCRRLVLLSR